MDTPWKRRDARRRSKRSEEEVGRLPGGSKQVNSGRGPFNSRRDNRLNEFLVETRDTDAGSYSIKRREFEDLTIEALRSTPSMLPAMRISIQGYPLIVMREKDYLAFKARMEAGDGRDSKTE